MYRFKFLDYNSSGLWPSFWYVSILIPRLQFFRAFGPLFGMYRFKFLDYNSFGPLALYLDHSCYWRILLAATLSAGKPNFRFRRLSVIAQRAGIVMGVIVGAVEAVCICAKNCNSRAKVLEWGERVV